MGNFKDHFSGHSSNYQKYRPVYPKELFAYLSSLCEVNGYAWDAGTGNGQCALNLVEYFDNVLATDPSANQIRDAGQHQRINYHVSKAEQCPESGNSFQLVTVAQALHWFDFEVFFREVKRVIKPGGVLAVWTYTHAMASPEVDDVYCRFYTDVVGKYWPKERQYVEDKYGSIPIPFDEIETPNFDIQVNYDLEDYLNYLGTWSAVKNYKLENKSDPIEQIRSEVTSAWGSPEEKKIVTWAIHLRAGRF